ncbi:glycosyltransferase family 2 protein [Luteibaculum oceani]|uniref:Glycosyltransferase family 2 protein n=1 Tax=Luteibaculum oceani TaxID=1294296 RepID=A0A5C6VIY1_9FLAO|nr:glycosyltransferase family 2 protein [Luteibaculum oceani]TXC85117.1 glycosyltransferase family 2 protein [Luteibaculum oceani]
MTGISVAIITKNEAANIERCIRSVKNIADEIVVVDSFSTDNTTEIAKSLGAKIIEQEFLGYKEQKNFARDKCSNTWVLSLDADEALSPELEKSIKKANLNSFDAFEMNRLSEFCGKWIRHGSWYPDRKIRLFKNDSGYWGGRNPHDKYILYPGKKLGFLKGDILHYTFQSFEQHEKQIEHFSSISAQALFEKGKKWYPGKPELRATMRFVRNYILKAGFLDGKMGLYIAKKSAGATYKKYVKLKRLIDEKHG